jgi:acyl carrier protein
MSDEKVMQRLQQVFDRVFVEPPTLRMDLQASEVPEWDSLKHVELLMAVEKEFSPNLTVGEMTSIQQVGDLVRILAQRQG